MVLISTTTATMTTVVIAKTKVFTITLVGTAFQIIARLSLSHSDLNQFACSTIIIVIIVAIAIIAAIAIIVIAIIIIVVQFYIPFTTTVATTTITTTLLESSIAGPKKIVIGFAEIAVIAAAIGY